MTAHGRRRCARGHAMAMEPRFRGSGVELDARLRTCTLMPQFANKYPRISIALRREVLRSFSLVVV